MVAKRVSSGRISFRRSRFVFFPSEGFQRLAAQKAFAPSEEAGQASSPQPFLSVTGFAKVRTAKLPAMEPAGSRIPYNR